ncbi:MAG TPA: tRNA epoxyqueuosine(34) reductase QueG [Terriglobia bacterium]|nr:tRNA epoxyqueuosine(34) reductase QueG [Terriglobia bacterium]
MALKHLLKQKALETGFDLVGVAPVGVWEDLKFARQWVEQGYGGEMRYLENPRRHDPRLVLPTAQSVLCVGLIYNAAFPYSTEASAGPSVDEIKPASSMPFDGAAGPRAWISRYAWGQDYHETMRLRLEKLRQAIESLEPGAETRVYVDTGPIVERAFARYSGIGWTGKNTCLINPVKGSWFFLGVVLTSLAIGPDLPAPDRCGSCTRCLDACPTGALTTPYVMDASRCIAYFNIELKGPIPEQYRQKIGANMFGCDICQDVCPWNRRQETEVRSQKSGSQRSAISRQPAEKGLGRAGAATTTLPEFQPLAVTLSSSCDGAEAGTGGVPPNRACEDRQSPSSARSFSLFNPPIAALAQVSEEDFRRAFAHSPIKRPKYRGWLRNLCVVMGNSGDRRFLPRIEELSRHRDPTVREHAGWAIGQLVKD